ncbi:MAG: hypothetical protein ACRDDF_02205 [Aeromonas sp.]
MDLTRYQTNYPIFNSNAHVSNVFSLLSFDFDDSFDYLCYGVNPNVMQKSEYEINNCRIMPVDEKLSKDGTLMENIGENIINFEELLDSHIESLTSTIIKIQWKIQTRCHWTPGVKAHQKYQ